MKPGLEADAPLGRGLRLHIEEREFGAKELPAEDVEATAEGPAHAGRRHEVEPIGARADVESDVRRDGERGAREIVKKEADLGSNAALAADASTRPLRLLMVMAALITMQAAAGGARREAR